MSGERRPVADWATDWDHTGREYHDHAPEVWAELRRRCPVAHTNRFRGAWFPVRHEDITAVAADPETFSSRIVGLSDGPALPLEVPPLTFDPPAHTAYRRVLLPRLAAAEVAGLEPWLRNLCSELIDDLADRRAVDAVADYAQPIPVLVTARLLGLADSQAELFRGYVHDIVERGIQDPARGREATAELLRFFRREIEDRRSNGGDDLTSWVAAAEVDGEPMSDRLKTAMLLLLVVAGLDTTWSVLGSALWHLAAHPDDQARLRRRPDLLPAAIEEFLRFYAPVEASRVATRDTTLGGQPVRAGDRVLLSYRAANRDPSSFTRADLFVLDRAANRHVAFGVGIHRCVGSHLARLELRVALETWLNRVPSFTLNPDEPVEWTSGGNVHGPRRLPLTL